MTIIVIILRVGLMSKKRVYSKYAKDAVHLLGQQIKLARKQQGWTVQNLAERAGISRMTLQKIEHGEMTCSIGMVFEVAAIVGVELFAQDNLSLTKHIQQAQDKLALLPERIQVNKKVVDDDF